MLIALFTALYLLLGGGGVETLFTDIKKPVKAAIGDDDRRDEILDLSKALSKRLKGNQDDWEGELEALTKLQRAAGAEPVEFDRSASRLEQLLVQRHELVFETRAKMKALMSEEEWNTVFAHR